MTRENILVVAAHPDDEVLGCGATVARLAREGHGVYLAVLGEGATSRKPTRSEGSPEECLGLAECARQAAGVLSARDVFFFNLPDNRFDSVDLLDIVKLVEPLLAELRPSVIFTHHGGDLNIDHSLAFRAVLTAARPLPGASSRSLYCFETPSATDWSFGKVGQGFSTDTFFDVSQTLDVKVRALDCYRGEMRPFPHPRSETAVRACAARWGSLAGLPAAEAFETVYSIK